MADHSRMQDGMDLLIATHNRHKLAEIRSIWRDTGLRLLGVDDVPGLPEVEEDGDTFEANAVKKAAALARMAGCWAMADDSGLVVPALGGAPGVYSARLLLNEAPFPGERGWVSEDNTKATMLAILWVCHGRIHHVPKGHRQSQIAAVTTRDIIDVITVGGEKGQCDGFYRDKKGKFKAVPRVHERIDYLLQVSNKGAPGRFARLILYAQGLTDA